MRAAGAEERGAHQRSLTGGEALDVELGVVDLDESGHRGECGEYKASYPPIIESHTSLAVPSILAMTSDAAAPGVALTSSPSSS